MTEGNGEAHDLVRLERIPETIARRLDDPPAAPEPARPAATLVLVRPGSAEDEKRGVEVLLVRRTRSARFVPGAWVFPGGLVEPSDAESGLVRRADRFVSGAPDEPPPTGREAPGAEARADGGPPSPAFVVAAVREAFEETGLLVARTADGGGVLSARDDAGLRELRWEVQDDAAAFRRVLERSGSRIDGPAFAYIAHWVTPAIAPRRYDTRFFAAAVPRSAEPEVDGTEVTEARWLRPAEALARHREGRLPMILPTVRTLESLRGFPSPDPLLRAFAGRRIPRILPRFVRTEEGPGLLVREAD